MAIILSGSLAHDYIMTFPGKFKEHILPDKIHMLNVSFNIATLQKNFGGTAGNIAYTVKLLGGDPVIVSALGKDNEEYIEHLQKNDITINGIGVFEDDYTPSAHITTDLDGNQITSFHTGVGLCAMKVDLFKEEPNPPLVIISPAHPEVMMKHVRECAEKNIPFVFDPGQVISAHTLSNMREAIEKAFFFISNEYEFHMTLDKTGWSKEELIRKVDVLITTLGEKGSEIISAEGKINVFAAEPKEVVDPTGAGDAYRSGFFYAYSKGFSLKECGEIGSIAGVYGVEHSGAQNHMFTIEEFNNRFTNTYGYTIGI